MKVGIDFRKLGGMIISLFRVFILKGRKKLNLANFDLMVNLFEGFLKKVLSTGKTNPQSAFDLGRDAQFGALSKLLVKKGVITQGELDSELEQEFSRIASMIEKMPPLPKA